MRREPTAMRVRGVVINYVIRYPRGLISGFATRRGRVECREDVDDEEMPRARAPESLLIDRGRILIARLYHDTENCSRQALAGTFEVQFTDSRGFRIPRH